MPERKANVVVALAAALALAGCGAGDGRTNAPAGSTASLSERADAAAQDFVERLGTQNVRAITWNWSNGRPPDACYALWAGVEGQAAPDRRELCEQWAEDLAALFGSYGVQADPLVFKSAWFRSFRDDGSYYGSQYMAWENGDARHPDCSDFRAQSRWRPVVVTARMGVVSCPEGEG